MSKVLGDKTHIRLGGNIYLKDVAVKIRTTSAKKRIANCSFAAGKSARQVATMLAVEKAHAVSITNGTNVVFSLYEEELPSFGIDDTKFPAEE